MTQLSASASRNAKTQERSQGSHCARQERAGYHHGVVLPAPIERVVAILTALATVPLASGCRGCHDVPEPSPGTGIEALRRSAPADGAPPIVDLRAQDKDTPLPDPQVDAVVHAQIEPEATRCYEVGLQKNAKQSGTVVLIIKLMANGKVDTVSAGADGALAVETVDCIQWVAKRAVFDPPGDAGRMIRVPLTFPR